jgi:hypothetical protein
MRATRLKVHWLFLAIVLLVGAIPNVAYAEPALDARQLTATNNVDTSAVDGNIVAWATTGCVNNLGCSYPAAVHFSDGVTEHLVTEDRSDTRYDNMKIDNGRIFWRRSYNFSDAQLIMYTIATGQITQVSNEPSKVVAGEFDVSGPNIVWPAIVQDFNGYSDLMLYDIDSGASRNLTASMDVPYQFSDSNPSIDGNIVAWARFPSYGGPGDSEIYKMDIQTNDVTRLTQDSRTDYNPTVSGQRIAWSKVNNSPTLPVAITELYMNDGTQTSRMSDEGMVANEYSFAGTKLAWLTWPAGQAIVSAVIMDVSDSSREVLSGDDAPYLTPVTNGTWVRWFNRLQGPSYQYSNVVYLKNLQTGQLIFQKVPDFRFGGGAADSVGDGVVIWTNFGDLWVGRLADATPPTAPTGLQITNPTNLPTLSWTAVDGATSYDVYRDGAKIGTSTTTTFTDSALSVEGNHTYYVVALNTFLQESPSSTSVDAIFDKTVPTLGVPSWSQNPKAMNQSSDLNIPATDNLTGIAGGEYFLGDTDPGAGNGIAMSASAGNITTSFGTNLQPGIYKVSARAKDAAGNWSAVTSDYLTVFDPSGPTDVAASKRALPDITGGDKLPGLLSEAQNDRASLAFDVSYTATGTVSAASKLSMDYSTGHACNSANPDNCHNTSFTTSTVSPNVINWLAINGANSSVGTFQGQGTLVIDGVTTTNPFKVAALDGNRTTPTTNDDAILYIYSPGANPETATPLYQLHINIIGNWVKIQ